MPHQLKLRSVKKRNILRQFLILPLFMHINSALADSNIPHNAIGRLYSNAELTVELATKPNLQACQDDVCLEQNTQFTQRVLSLGDALQARAYALDETLKTRIPQFHFMVADKASLGTISDASGNVVIFRGLQTVDLSDEALSFLMAREMAHVITGHHDKNVAKKLMISAFASILFPALAIVSASSAAQQASTATTIATNAASTATSLLGGEAAVKQVKPSQLKESDEWALKLMGEEMVVDIAMITEQLDQALAQMNERLKNSWTKDLVKSIAFLQEKSSKTNTQPTVLQAEVD